ncbi:hypothetical protein CPA46_01195 [Sphingopyxis terrae subsp. ummariensis]|nr:hypothetical protein CPA46_01195 [Sphingopyxis terrae subsp. ummariensis]
MISVGFPPGTATIKLRYNMPDLVCVRRRALLDLSSLDLANEPVWIAEMEIFLFPNGVGELSSNDHIASGMNLINR